MYTHIIYSPAWASLIRKELWWSWTLNLFFELYFTRKKKKKFGGFPLKFPQRILWVGTQNVFIYALLRIGHVFDVSVDSCVPVAVTYRSVIQWARSAIMNRYLGPHCKDRLPRAVVGYALDFSPRAKSGLRLPRIFSGCWNLCWSAVTLAYPSDRPVWGTCRATEGWMIGSWGWRSWCPSCRRFFCT